MIAWSHAAQPIWTVAHAAQGGSPCAAQCWAEAQLDALWSGQVATVVQTLDRFHVDQESYPPLVQPAPDYFQLWQKPMQPDQFRTKG
jgi:hypothetical protein